MKTLKYFLSVLVLIISFNTIAQQGINYKAQIKDINSNVVANQSITIQFRILQGQGATEELVFQETLISTTDANGIIIVNIGADETNDISGINWGIDDHYLNVQIDTGGGLTDMGTTQFMAVPYALHAKTTDNPASGLEKIDEGNGIGWRLIGRNPINYGDIGNGAVDFSYSDSDTPSGATGEQSTAFGLATKAVGIGSAAFGYLSTASGQYSVAIGSSSHADGNNSLAIGTLAKAMEDESFASGYDTAATGFRSTAMGISTKANSYGSTSIGIYNIGGGDKYTPESTDPLFEIGNGSPTVSSNALTVLKNGNTGIGTHTPNTKLHISGGIDASLTSGSGFIVMGSISGENMVMDSNEIMARNNGSPGPLFLQYNAEKIMAGGEIDLNNSYVSGASKAAVRVKGDEAIWYNGTYFSWGYDATYNYFQRSLGLGVFNPNVRLDVNGSIEYTGTITDVSDRRLKENLKPMENVLQKLLQIDTYTFNMKGDELKKMEYGVIAQELQKIFPDLVSTVDKDNDLLGVSYVQLIPVLIEAIQEQQDIINSLKTENDRQQKAFESQSQAIKIMMTKLEKLELAIDSN